MVMPQQQLDYESPRSASKRPHVAGAVPLLVLVGVEIALVLFLIGNGQDRTPGSWNDWFVLVVLNPASHIVLGLVFLVGSLFLKRRAGPFVLYALAAVIVPLTGALVVYNAVCHHR
jgi:hypothetical protein